MDEVLASAGAKLAKTEHPITALRHKYQLLQLQEESDRLQRVLEQGEEILVHENRKTWMRRLFGGRVQAIRQIPTAENMRFRIDQVKQQLADLQEKSLQGILTPITLGEEYEIQAHYYAVRRQVQASFPTTDTTAEQRQAQAEAIEFTCSHASLAKEMEVALKRCEFKSVNGKDVMVLAQPVTRALTAKEAKDIDPRVTADVMREYRASFNLTDEELGK